MKKLVIAKVPAKIENSIEADNLISDMAMDIGKQVAHHIKTMYPDAVVNSSFLTSVRNCTYNEIMAAIQVNAEGEIIERLDKRNKSRRKEAKFYKEINK